MKKNFFFLKKSYFRIWHPIGTIWATKWITNLFQCFPTKQKQKVVAVFFAFASKSKIFSDAWGQHWIHSHFGLQRRHPRPKCDPIHYCHVPNLFQAICYKNPFSRIFWNFLELATLFITNKKLHATPNTNSKKILWRLMKAFTYLIPLYNIGRFWKFYITVLTPLAQRHLATGNKKFKWTFRTTYTM